MNHIVRDMWCKITKAMLHFLYCFFFFLFKTRS